MTTLGDSVKVVNFYSPRHNHIGEVSRLPDPAKPHQPWLRVRFPDGEEVPFLDQELKLLERNASIEDVSDAELRHLAMIDEDAAAEWRRRQVASHDLERSAPREMKARRQEPVAPRTPRTAIQGGEEKSWANGGYSGTVDDQLHAMDDTQRDEVYTEHPWLRPHGEDGSRF